MNKNKQQKSFYVTQQSLNEVETQRRESLFFDMFETFVERLKQDVDDIRDEIIISGKHREHLETGFKIYDRLSSLQYEIENGLLVSDIDKQNTLLNKTQIEIDRIDTLFPDAFFQFEKYGARKEREDLFKGLLEDFSVTSSETIGENPEIKDPLVMDVIAEEVTRGDGTVLETNYSKEEVDGLSIVDKGWIKKPRNPSKGKNRNNLG